MNRPSLLGMADALVITDPRFPWIGPSPDEKEVAAVLIEMDQIHTPDRDDPDNPLDDPIIRTFGFCLGCAEQWPCRAWRAQESEGVAWLGRAADRVHAHALGPVDPVIRAMGQHAGVTTTPPGDCQMPRPPCNVEIHPHRELREGTRS